MPRLIVDKNGAGLRLDRYLTKSLPNMPKGHIYKLLRNRKVRLNKKRAKAEDRLQQGDEVLIHMPQDQFAKDASRPVRKAVGMDFGVVFEDPHLLVVSKPPFLPVHSGRGHHSNSLIDQVHAYLEVQDQPGAYRPALAHRLDRDTSGLLIIGKDAESLRTISNMLKEGSMSKKYLALALGRPNPPRGTWELEVHRRDLPGAPKQRQPRRDRRKSMGITEYRVAVSKRVRFSKNDLVTVSLLVLTLHTGRTHQIRSHLLQAGYPLVGDRRYGDRDLNRKMKEHFGLKRQFLHAYRLTLAHPITAKPLHLVANYPHDLLPLVEHLRLGIPSH